MNPGMLFFGVIALAVCGLVVGYIGWRGRRIDDHPVCRGCGFDLFGLSDDNENCPECGRQVRAVRGVHRNVRTGNRRRRPALITLGAVMMFIAVGGGAVDRWAQLSEVNWHAYKPDGLLVWEVERGDPAAALEQVSELLQRLEDDGIGPAHRARLRDRALALHGDLDQPWTDEWADLLFQLREVGALEDEHFAQYLEQSVRVKFFSREDAVVGQITLIGCSYEYGRVDERDQFGLTVRTGPISAAGQEFARGGSEGRRRLSGAPGRPFSIEGGRSSYNHVISDEVGTFEVSGECIAEVHELTSANPGELHSEDSVPIHEWSVSKTYDVTVHPEGTALVQLIEDEALWEELSRQITVRDVRVRRFSSGRLFFECTVDAPPVHDVDMAFEVVAEAGGERLFTSSVIFRGGRALRQRYGVNNYLDVDEFPHETVTIHLRTDPSYAMREPDIMEILQGEATFEDLPVAFLE